jgi:WD40 repeat protein
MSFTGKQRVPYLTCDINSTGDTLAASTELQTSDASIDIFDLKSSKVLHTYTESHSDDITVLSFHPDSSTERSRTLLSAGEDGLLCTYDTRGADEDDCVIGTGNMEASVAHAGWMESIPGRMSDGIWESCFAVTNMETLKLWSGSEVSLLQAPFSQIARLNGSSSSVRSGSRLRRCQRSSLPAMATRLCDRSFVRAHIFGASSSCGKSRVSK